MTEGRPADSFPKRFIYKLSSNLIGVFLGFFQAGLVSRALGPRSYGDYNFLINFFNQFVAFLEMRSATFLFTSFSRNRAKTGVVAVYFYVALAVSIVVVLFPLFAVSTGIQHAVWPGQNVSMIILVALLAVVLWYTDLFAKICDALRVTVLLERARVVNSVLLFIAIAVTMRGGLLTIRSYITLQFVTSLLLIGILAVTLRQTKAFEGQSLHPLRIEMRSTLGAVFEYSHPLFIYTLMAMAGDYVDRWLLQRFRGSVEQGLFSLALNIGLAFNVLINALYPLVMREFSVAFEENNLERARNVFRKLIPASYAVSAFFLCYAAMNAEGCVRIVGGRSYQDASGVFAIMAFLPILHNYSMLSGSALYAANRTKLIRNLGLIMTPLSIAATFFLVGPRQYGALDLGAAGLAIKVVALEFIGVNIGLYFNCKMLALDVRKYVFHQVSIVALLTGIAFVCREGAFYALGAAMSNWLLVMLVGGIVYVALALLMFYFIPSLVGVNRQEAIAFLKQAVMKSHSPLTRNPPVP